MRLLPLICALAGLPLAHAAICYPNSFQGAYGFLLSGSTSISGSSQPAAAVGRLVLDSSGNISGVSSVKFTGLLLGNPVTGMYRANVDCSVTWSLQDDSGNYQHFSGTMSEHGNRIQFQQSDPGGARNGIMLVSLSMCTDGNFHGTYTLRFSGDEIDVDTNRISGKVKYTGLVKANGAGELSYSPGVSAPFQHAGSYEVEDDCFVKIELNLPPQDNTAAWNFRAIVVNGGHDLLGIESDPGMVATLRLSTKQR